MYIAAVAICGGACNAYIDRSGTGVDAGENRSVEMEEASVGVAMDNGVDAVSSDNDGSLGLPTDGSASKDAGASHAAAGDADAASGDGGKADAGACIASGTYPAGSFGCPKSTWGSTPTARVMTVTHPIEFVEYVNHTLLWELATTTQLRPGCDGFGSPISPTSSGAGGIKVTLLQPGTYTWIRCDFLYSELSQNAPPTPPPNASCATASTSWGGGVRIFDKSKLYYRFTTTAAQSGSFYIQVRNSGMTSGSFTVEVQKTCDDSATDIAHRGGSAWLPVGTYDTTQITVVPNTTYWVVLSNIEAGTAPSVTGKWSFP